MTPENSGPEHDMTEPPFTTRHLGAIKAAAVIMAVLIIVLTAVLVATIISRLSGRVAPPDAAELTLPAGAELRAVRRTVAGDLGHAGIGARCRFRTVPTGSDVPAAARHSR